MSTNALRDTPGEQMSDGPADLFSKFDPLIQTREQLLSTGVTDPFGLVMEKSSARRSPYATGARRSCSAPIITWA